MDPIDCTIYGETAISQAYRILGFLDRDPESPHYGCFERNYWHYRQTDFVDGRRQEAAHFLALLYQYDHPANRFYRKERIRDWAAAAVRFWASIQRQDGSFDEYWPFERSFVATAFSLHAAAEACRILDLPPPADAIRKACRWLEGRGNMMVLNQMAGAAAALAGCAALLGDDGILRAAGAKMSLLLENQADEGYFEEYGGYDIGYLTINLSYLVKYELRTKSGVTMESVKRAMRFLDGKIFENGTYDYHAASRRTQYVYPFALRAMEEWELLSRHRRGLANNEVVNPSWMDDRYCVPLAIDYLQTAMHPEPCRE